MANPILDALQAEIKKGTPDKATALCKVLEHQFYMRDRSHGDLYQIIEGIKERLKKLEKATEGQQGCEPS